MKKIMISQSNYIPWKGFFDSIHTVDTYVIFDEVQFTKRDWRNRNQIKTASGPLWLTIPVNVSGKYTQKISEVQIADSSWANKHWQTLYHNYSKAENFRKYAAAIEETYKKAAELKYLSDVNLLFTQTICDFLNIKTEIVSSSKFNLDFDRNQKLIEICKDLGGTDYYTGPAAQSYLDEHAFNSSGIHVHYFKTSGYPEYNQLYPPFTHAVSILDTLFTVGDAASDYIYINS